MLETVIIQYLAKSFCIFFDIIIFHLQHLLSFRLIKMIPIDIPFHIRRHIVLDTFVLFHHTSEHVGRNISIWSLQQFETTIELRRQVFHLLLKFRIFQIISGCRQNRTVFTDTGWFPPCFKIKQRVCSHYKIIFHMGVDILQKFQCFKSIGISITFRSAYMPALPCFLIPQENSLFLVLISSPDHLKNEAQPLYQIFPNRIPDST